MKHQINQNKKKLQEKLQKINVKTLSIAIQQPLDRKSRFTEVDFPNTGDSTSNSGSSVFTNWSNI